MIVLKIVISQPWHAFSILVRINLDAYACDYFRSCGQQRIPHYSAYIVLGRLSLFGKLEPCHSIFEISICVVCFGVKWDL
jgi:hypothetical protein